MSLPVKTTFRIAAVLFLLQLSALSFGQTRYEKTVEIIGKLDLVEEQFSNYSCLLKSLKSLVSKGDTVKVLEMEKLLTKEEVLRRVVTVFDVVFNDEEISLFHQFVKTGAFEKMFTLNEVRKTITVRFSDIDRVIMELERSSYQQIMHNTN